MSTPEKPRRQLRIDLADLELAVEAASLELGRAIRGRGAFGRFRDVLAESPQERERWFECKRQRVRERIAEWLEDEIEATAEWRFT